jgi:hypothetical protein
VRTRVRASRRRLAIRAVVSREGALPFGGTDAGGCEEYPFLLI